jgi:hypothetical protein
MTERNDARLAGLAYLSYIVFTMTSVTLYGSALEGNEVAEQLAHFVGAIGQVRLSVLLDLLQVICALVLAVILYRLTKPVAETPAMLAMLFRVGEGLLGTSAINSTLELMKLTAGMQGHATEGTLAGGRYVITKPDSQFAEFCFVVGGLLFAWLLLRGHRIPKPLAWIGVITIGVQVVFVPLQTASFITASIVDNKWLFIMLFEIPLGFWLVFKGVKPVAGGQVSFGRNEPRLCGTLRG